MSTSSRPAKRRNMFPESHRRDAHQLYNELWGKSTDATHFIAPTPVSLERVHLGNLCETHLVTEKSDGERHMLLVGVPPGEDDAYVVLVPRKPPAETSRVAGGSGGAGSTPIFSRSAGRSGRGHGCSTASSCRTVPFAFSTPCAWEGTI